MGFLKKVTKKLKKAVGKKAFDVATLGSAFGPLKHTFAKVDPAGRKSLSKVIEKFKRPFLGGAAGLALSLALGPAGLALGPMFSLPLIGGGAAAGGKKQEQKTFELQASKHAEIQQQRKEKANVDLENLIRPLRPQNVSGIVPQSSQTQPFSQNLSPREKRRRQMAQLLAQQRRF